MKINTNPSTISYSYDTDLWEMALTDWKIDEKNIVAIEESIDTNIDKLSSIIESIEVAYPTKKSNPSTISYSYDMDLLEMALTESPLDEQGVLELEKAIDQDIEKLETIIQLVDKTARANHNLNLLIEKYGIEIVEMMMINPDDTSARSIQGRHVSQLDKLTKPIKTLIKKMLGS